MNQYSLMPNLPGAAPLQTNDIATLRDQFAMAALTGLAIYGCKGMADHEWSVVSKIAYEVADQMLAARG